MVRLFGTLKTWCSFEGYLIIVVLLGRPQQSMSLVNASTEASLDERGQLRKAAFEQHHKRPGQGPYSGMVLDMRENAQHDRHRKDRRA